MHIRVRRRVLRTLFFIAASLGIAFVALVLALRLWILPDLDQWRGDIASSISHSTRQKVELGRLSANWQHWHPQLFIQYVRVLGQNDRPILYLTNVRAELSWTSLIFREVRLTSLSLDNLVLGMRRDNTGAVYLAEFLVNGPKHKNYLVDWLLKQHEIKVSNATLSWQDDLRAAPLLLVSQINVDLINLGRSHHIHVTASPPANIAQPIEFDAKLNGKDVDDPASWSGQATATITRTDLSQWQPWITLPYGVTRGQGNLNLQLQLAKNQIIAVTANTSIQQLSLQLKPDLPELDLISLSAQVKWKRLGTAQSIELQHINLRTRDLVSIPDLNFYLRVAPASAKAPASGDLRLNRVSLQTLTRLSTYLPLTPAQRTQLSQRQPGGTFEQIKAHWQGDLTHPETYQVQGQFTQLGLASTPTSPGFSGLSGQIDANDKNGSLILSSQHASVDLTGILFEPHIALDTLAVQLRWIKTKPGYDIKLSEVHFANADAAGSLLGEYQWQPGQRGVLNLSGDLTRGNAAAVYHYLPLAVKQPAHDWVRTNLLGGTVTGAQFQIKGDLANFPFHNDKNGLLAVQVKFRDGSLQPDPEFPAIDHIDGNMRFFGTSMLVQADSAKLYSSNLHDISASIPDLFGGDKETLYAKGKGEGALTDLIRFTNNSPIHKALDDLTAGATGTGNAQLSLQLRLPFHDILHPVVNGVIHFQNNTITPHKPLPELDAVSGRLDFTQSGVSARNISLNILGGAATAAAKTLPGGIVHISVQGQMTGPGLTPYLPPDIVAKIGGGAAWQGNISVAHGHPPTMSFDSSLAGMMIGLPQPFHKIAADPMPLHIDAGPADDSNMLIDIRYGDLVTAELLRAVQADAQPIQRVAINFGGTATLPAAPGLWVSGHIPILDLTGWSTEPQSGASSEIPPKIDVKVSVGQLDLFQRQFQDISLHTENIGTQWRTAVSSATMRGSIDWKPHVTSAQHDKLSAHFKTLTIPEATPGAGPVTEINTTHWPELALDVADLQIGKRHLGHLDVQAVPIADGLRFDHITLTASDSTLKMSAVWRPKIIPETVAALRLNIKNIGQFFDRYGHRDTIKGGSAIIDGQANWNGTPVDITLTSLAGQFTLTAENGQFLKIEPGAARLLGILSLQALPRHIGLDFSDIFSDGFAFEDISATLKLDHGIIHSQDFLMDGPAASVQMNGTINMNAQTQQLHASVSPKLNGTVALASSLLGGPVVALGVYAAQELLKNPFGHAIRYDYTITGSWADPLIKKGE